MAHIVRVWLVTPPVGVAHPKTEVLRIAARRGTLALRARKVDESGVMRVVARGLSEDLAAFNADLHHKVHDDKWARNELAATPDDVASVEGGALVILRSEDSVTSGADSSGRKPPPAAGDASPVDTGSTASSRIIVAEVKLERSRGEAAVRVVAAREAAALEAAAAAEAREAATLDAAIAALMKLALISRSDAEAAIRSAR